MPWNGQQRVDPDPELAELDGKSLHQAVGPGLGGDVAPESRVRHQACGRRGDHDVATTALAQELARRRLRAEEDPGQVHRDDLVEVVERRVDERHLTEPDLRDARVAVHDVEATEGVDRGLHRRFHVVGTGHVGSGVRRFAAGGLDLFGHRLHVGVDDVGGDDLGPFGCEQAAGITTETVSCAGDHHNFVLESHGSPPPSTTFDLRQPSTTFDGAAHPTLRCPGVLARRRRGARPTRCRDGDVCGIPGDDRRRRARYGR